MRANNVIVLVEFFSNNGFQLLFLDVLLSFAPDKGRSDSIVI